MRLRTSRHPAGDPRIAIGYIRVSKEEQQLSPEAQRTAIEAYARRAGLGIVDWFLDHLCGATDLEDRPGLIAALAALHEQRAGVLLVLRRDRIARDAAVAALIDRKAALSGARILSSDGVANGDSPADAFMRTIFDGAAEFERALIRARTKASLATKKTRGERIGTVPYGYRLADDGRHLLPEPAEQAVIDKVRALRQVPLPLRQIVDRLEQEGVRGRRGHPLRLTQVARMVSRESAASPMGRAATDSMPEANPPG
jgi:DNA invertase Pin-like site-specific DNA recombinase